MTGIDLVPLPSNLVPMVPVASPYPTPVAAAPLPSNSLLRMSELQHFLNQCDAPSYVKNYLSVSTFHCTIYAHHTLLSFSKACLLPGFTAAHPLTRPCLLCPPLQLLESSPVEMLSDFANQLRERAEWLDDQEQKESRRARQANLLPLGPNTVPVMPPSSQYGMFVPQETPAPMAPVAVKAPTITPEAVGPLGLSGGQVPMVAEHQLLRPSVTPEGIVPVEKPGVVEEAQENRMVTRQSKLKRKERS